MYNEFYINSYSENQYIKSLRNATLLSNISKNYLLQYTDNINIEMLLFKESLDHFVCKKINNNQEFIKTIEFHNYVRYIYNIIRQKKYIINDGNQFNLLIEINSNVVFYSLNNDLLQKIFGQEIVRLKENNQKYLKYLFSKMSNKLTQNELIILADYLNNKKDYQSDEYDKFLTYLFNNIKEISLSKVILNTIMVSLNKEIQNDQKRLYIGNNEVHNNYASFKYIESSDKLNSLITLINNVFIFGFSSLNNDRFTKYINDLSHYSININNGIRLINEEEAYIKSFNFINKYINDNQKALINNYFNNILTTIKFKKIIYELKQGLDNNFFDMASIETKIKNHEIVLNNNSNIYNLFDYNGNLKYNDLFECVVSENSASKLLVRYMFEKVKLDDLKAIVGNGVCSINNVQNLMENAKKNLEYYLYLLKEFHKLKNSNQEEINNLCNNNIENYYFKLICEEILKTNELLNTIRSRSFMINSELIDSIQNLYQQLILEEMDDIDKVKKEDLVDICNRFNQYHNLQEISKLIQNKANINVDNILKEKNKKEKKALIINNVKDKVKKRKKLLLILLFGLIVGIGIYSYLNYANEIHLKNAKMFPSFNKYIEQYVIYTKEDNVEFKCSSLKYDNCKKVSLNAKETMHDITTNDATYQFKIIKIGKDEASVKIDEINGIPKDWINETNINVELENPEFVYVKYSFDNGKNWYDDNSIYVNENTSLDIVVKDYFDFITPVKHVEINKIDNEKPEVKIVKTKVNNGIQLEAVANDNISGISSYAWNNKSVNKIITVNSNGDYQVTVFDKAGNYTVASFSLNEEEKTYKATFDNNGKIEEITCKTFGNECSIIAPKTVTGWSLKQNSNSVDFKSGSNITLKSNTNFYVVENVTIKPSENIQEDNNDGELKVKFVIQDKNATKQSDTTLSCANNSNCKIDSPLIAANSGYDIIGWNENKNATTASIKNGQSINISSIKTYYLISKKNAPLTVNLILQDNNLTTTSTSESCYLYNGASSCNIVVPKLSSSSSSVKAIGWNTNQYAVKANKSGTISINKNTNLYSVSSYQTNAVNHDDSTFPIQVVKIKKYGYVTLEIEDGMNEATASKFISTLDQLFKDYPQLFYYDGNVVFLNKATYSKFKNMEGSSGWTYSYKKNNTIQGNVYIGYLVEDFYRFTVVHELFHVYDYKFSIMFGKEVSEQSDIKNIYQNYSQMSSSTRPFRDYSYSNIHEFTADGFAFYYYSLKGYKSSNYGNAITSDISQLLKKYMNNGLNYYKGKGIIK